MDVLGTGSLLERIVRRILIVLIMAIFLGPIVLLVLTSFKTRADALASPPVWFFSPTTENYRHVFSEYDLGHFFQNSVIIASCSTVLALMLGSLAAYGLSRFDFRGSNALGYWILSLRMMPAVAVVIPIFIILRNIDLIDTRLGMIIVYVSANVPLVIWLMKSFFDDLPRDIEDSSLIDGSTRIGAFARIALPLIGPGLSATAILTFVFIWNEFLFALILTGNRAQTVPVAVTLFMRQTGIEWGYMTAAATVMMLPMIVCTFFVRRGLTRGLTLGAVK
ncbi:MAG: carbohydrate ABC transporter permease [Thermomicrobiales bacterium]|nr:carbohydrate ABC transporter permease [Thermomicrobiales bacterium]